MFRAPVKPSRHGHAFVLMTGSEDSVVAEHWLRPIGCKGFPPYSAPYKMAVPSPWILLDACVCSVRHLMLFDLLQGLDWEFLVVDENQENAFVVPGGKVVVYTGLIRMLADEEELATVLSHEVAHVLARHVVRADACPTSCSCTSQVTMLHYRSVQTWKQRSTALAGHLQLSVIASGAVPVLSDLPAVP